jgi:chromosome segregation protein
VYLKRLELQGFKSFAPRTTLEFSPGITAIVGPNGSGKSNIADAIRWVLGEQSMRQLRGRKSNDIIFAGGQGRAPMQMAEVGLLLDNSASWLPSEHTEVTATRRSFRSGESEYLINGQRVRLRDMFLLLAQARIGHDSYTVIGQGLVDQALSLRAEERRGLFEDAAGIRQFQAQRTDAEQKLALTQTNLSRLRDIVAEIAPRLAPLAEQARRAREHAGARDELRRLVRTWYAWQWQETVEARSRADTAETEQAERIASVKARMAADETHAQEVRAARDTAAGQLGELRRTRGEASARLQTLDRDQAVGQERHASLERQAVDLVSEQGQQEAAVAAAQAEVASLETQLAATEDQIQALTGQLEALEHAQHAARQVHEREEAQLRGAQRDVIQVQARLGAAQTELGRLQRQVGDRNRTLAARREAVAAARQRLDAAGSALESRRAAFELAHADVEALVAHRDELTHALAAGQEELEQARRALADAQRERHALADRLALLEEWRGGLADYANGARAILQAPEDSRPPVVGALAQLVRATPGYEAAIEGVLGPFVQALVVASAEDALTCAEWLRQRSAGHALLVWPPTDVPIDEDAQRGSGAVRDTTQGMPAQEDGSIRGSILGRMTDNVETQPELRALIEHLMAGTYLVRDLKAAQALMASQRHDLVLDRGVTGVMRALVTPGGELLHQDDWARGGAGESSPERAGAPGGAGALLARERELRQLPAELDRWTSDIAELEARHARASALQQGRRDDVDALTQELQGAEARAQELAREVAALQREAERAQSEAQLSQAVADQLADEIAGVEQDVAATATRVVEQEASQHEALDRVRAVQEVLDELAERNRAQQEDLARQRTSVAVQQQEAKTLAQRVDQVRAQAHEVALHIERRAERVQSIAVQRAQLEEDAARRHEASQELRGQIRELSAAIQQHEATAAAAEQELVKSERTQALGRQELESAEVEYRRRMMEAQRARDAVEALLVQLRDELEDLGELGESRASPATGSGGKAENDTQDARTLLAGVGAAEAADASAEVEGSHASAIHQSRPSLQLAPEDAARMRRQIDSLRNRLRHLGGYDPDAPQAYEELKTRHEFLAGQVRDMEQASANLRTIIGELDATMRRQFAETFEAVNLRFQRHFATLFAGGTARLEMTAPRKRALDDEEEDSDLPEGAAKSVGAGGVEVYVQIPGKRVQDLSLLSGGERAMVSAALLFALLETNPPPFCLLDEVDAALDAANVVRFCDILKVLAQQTQFIVITHNQITMTHAGAIYGISMNTESISRVVSLKLAEVRA